MKPLWLSCTLAIVLAAGCRKPAASADDAAVESRAPTETPVVTLVPSGGNPVRVQVELALTEREQARGLMHREHLPEGRGMLFVFSEEGPRSFWMRNTLIPLDMIFIGADRRVVGVVHEAEPLTETPRRVDAPSQYVLEVPGGWARAQGIGVGTEVRFEHVPAPD